MNHTQKYNLIKSAGFARGLSRLGRKALGGTGRTAAAPFKSIKKDFDHLDKLDESRDLGFSSSFSQRAKSIGKIYGKGAALSSPFLYSAYNYMPIMPVKRIPQTEGTPDMKTQETAENVLSGSVGYGSKELLFDKMQRAEKYKQKLEEQGVDIPDGFLTSTNKEDYKKPVDIYHYDRINLDEGGRYQPGMHKGIALFNRDWQETSKYNFYNSAKAHEITHKLQDDIDPWYKYDTDMSSYLNEDAIKSDSDGYTGSKGYYTNSPEVGARVGHIGRQYEQHAGEINSPEDAKKAFEWYRKNMMDQDNDLQRKRHGNEKNWFDAYDTPKIHKLMPALTNLKSRVDKMQNYS